MGLGDLVDKAASALGAGDAGGDGPKPDAAKPKFEDGGPLDPPKDKKPIISGPNGENTPPNKASPPETIEFIHYGKVHTDTTDHYTHPKFDNEKDKKPIGRGILFRDALEREAVLLFGYITATKTVQEELKKNRGPAGEIAGAIGSLTGSSGKEPDPSSYKHLLNAITKAGGEINAEKCDYLKIHKAGIDLHQVRSDYIKYIDEKIGPYYLGKKDDDKALLMSLPAVSGVAKTIFGILFKAFNIYFAMHLKFRTAYEGPIADACYKFGLEKVKKYEPHTYAPWFKPPKEEEKKEEKKSTLPSFLGDAENQVNETKKDVVDFAGEAKKAEPGPGEPVINEIFGLLGSGASDDDKKKKEGEAEKEKKADPAPSNKEAEKKKPAPIPPDKLAVEAFNAILGTTIPGFLGTAIGKMAWGNVEFLKAIYIRLSNDNGKTIDEAWLNETAHSCLFNKLYSFIEENVGFIKKVEDFTYGVQGEQLGPGKQIQKGKDALAQKLGSYADPVLKMTVTKIAGKLEEIRAEAEKNKAMTMEVFLAWLPYLLAFQIRNTTFPVWDLLINELLGKGNAALDTALKPVRGFIGDARDMAGKIKDYKDKGQEFKDKWDKEGLVMNNTAQNMTQYKDILTKDKPKQDPNKAGGGGSFPGGSRTTPGNAEKIPQADVEKARKERKDPWPVKP
jgi:hypothetical protein